jgi:hypothetical protein
MGLIVVLRNRHSIDGGLASRGLLHSRRQPMFPKPLTLIQEFDFHLISVNRENESRSSYDLNISIGEGHPCLKLISLYV